MEVCIQFHGPAALGAWVGARASLDAVQKRKHCLLLPGIETRFLGFLTSSLVATLSELPRLHEATE
jgi:hypothetical protein